MQSPRLPHERRCSGKSKISATLLEPHTMVIEEKILIDCPAQVIYAIYTEVSQWHTWDPDTRSASLNGPFAAGSQGRLEPSQGRPITMTLTDVQPNRCFAVVGGIPGFSMRFEHELTSVATGTEAIHRVSFSGPLRFVLGPLIGAQVRKGLPITMRSLKAHAEARFATAA